MRGDIPKGGFGAQMAMLPKYNQMTWMQKGDYEHVQPERVCGMCYSDIKTEDK